MRLERVNEAVDGLDSMENTILKKTCKHGMTRPWYFYEAALTTSQ